MADDATPEPGAPESFDADATERDGRATALTVLTPMPRCWAPAVRLVLWLKSQVGPDKQLQELAFIHVAHWAVLTDLPQQRHRNRYAHLLFMSNFNGSWRDYIDAFSLAVPGKMALIWGTAFGFPGATPPRPFVSYIARNDLTPDHYWAAYPDASAIEAASALRVSAAFRSRRWPDAGRPAELAGAWRSFLTQVQRDL